MTAPTDDPSKPEGSLGSSHSSEFGEFTRANRNFTGAKGRRPWRRRHVVLALAAAALIFVWWFIPAVWRLSNGPVEVTRFNSKSGPIKVLVGPGQKGWISTNKISKHALHAIVAAEDENFYKHHGFDFDSIRKSYETNLKKHRYARGGSTLSQQVVKMAFLSREKTITRKVREAVGTVLMEHFYSKDEILEWYINLAEFGDGVYGIADACRHYFKTKPELLTIEQSTHLALVLPSPNGWSKGLRQRSLTKFGQRRFAAILNGMRGLGFITKTQWLTALSRGDFGRPIHGYEALVAADQAHQSLCPGGPDCADDVPEDKRDDDEDEDISSSTPDMAAPAPSVRSGPAAPEFTAPTVIVPVPTKQAEPSTTPSVVPAGSPIPQGVQAAPSPTPLPFPEADEPKEAPP